MQGLGLIAFVSCCYCSAEDTEVPAKGKKLVSTGIAIHTPPGTYGRVAPRSGLACKNFIDVGAGVIDEDYRGEVKVLLFNFGEEAFKGKVLSSAVFFAVPLLLPL
jgi:dUTP pyrophosphatase